MRLPAPYRWCRRTSIPASRGPRSGSTRAGGARPEMSGVAVGAGASAGQPTGARRTGPRRVRGDARADRDARAGRFAAGDGGAAAARPSRRSPPLAEVRDRAEPDAKTALYLIAFAVILPAAVLVVPRRADSIARRCRAARGHAPVGRCWRRAPAPRSIVVRLLPGGAAWTRCSPASRCGGRSPRSLLAGAARGRGRGPRPRVGGPRGAWPSGRLLVGVAALHGGTPAG